MGLARERRVMLPTFKRGERASAGKLNMLAEAIGKIADAIAGVRGGRGVRVDKVAGSLVISMLDPEKEDLRQGVVDSVEPADTDGNPTPAYPDDVKYTIRCAGFVGSGEEDTAEGLLQHEDFDVVVNRPAYGTGKEKIIGQSKGTGVLVWNRKTQDGAPELVLIVLEERPYTKVCGT